MHQYPDIRGSRSGRRCYRIAGSCHFRRHRAASARRRRIPSECTQNSDSSAIWAYEISFIILHHTHVRQQTIPIKWYIPTHHDLVSIKPIIHAHHRQIYAYTFVLPIRLHRKKAAPQQCGTVSPTGFGSSRRPCPDIHFGRIVQMLPVWYQRTASGRISFILPVIFSTQPPLKMAQAAMSGARISSGVNSSAAARQPPRHCSA